MDRRKLCAGVAAFASSFLLLGGVALAHGNATPSTPVSSDTCTIESLPSFMAQGEFNNQSMVADVIEVSCDPAKYSQGAPITITASQLYDRCNQNISWYKPNEDGEDEVTTGRSVTLRLDVNGNANIGLIAGPECHVGESLMTISEDEWPFETIVTPFQVLSTKNTPEELTMLPAKQVEDQESSGVITIAQAEFPGQSEKKVRIGSRELYDRCEREDHLIVVKENREEFDNVVEVQNAIELDNNGNGFALLMGADSCNEGTSTVEADLEANPFKTLVANFTIEPPHQRF